MNQIEPVGINLTIILVVAFYIRLMIMQYDRSKRAKARAQTGKKALIVNPRNQIPFFFGVTVISWPWVIAACVLLVAGAVMSAVPNITTPYWWLPLDSGIVILWFFLK